MRWQLPHTKRPAYLRVIHLIAAGIEAGELLPGTRLPAERLLAQELGVNRSTIQRALGELVSQGLLTRQVGSGTWVSQDKWGVASSTQWHDYLSTNRLSGPDPFVVRLNAARKMPGAINLADSVIGPDLAIPVKPEDLSVPEMYAQERQMDITGDKALKEALCQRLKSAMGDTLTPDHLLITSGAQQAYYLISQGLLSDGDAVAVESPSYFYQLTLFQAAGIRIYGVPLTNGELDLNVLADVYHQHHVRFLFVNPTGQNPTGATMSLANRNKLLAACRALHLPVVEDDLLGINSVLGQPTPPPLHALDADNVLTIGSLSPLVGPHTRIGWLIAPPGVVQRLAQIRQQMEAEVSVFPQQLAAQMLCQDDLQQSALTQQAQLAKRQAALTQVLAPLAAQGILSFTPPAANYHFWVTLNQPHILGAADYQAWLQAGVLTRPDFLFGTHRNQVRLSFAHFLPEQIPALRNKLGLLLTPSSSN